jgi:hypothetical protein
MLIRTVHIAEGCYRGHLLRLHGLSYAMVELTTEFSAGQGPRRSAVHKLDSTRHPTAKERASKIRTSADELPGGGGSNAKERTERTAHRQDCGNVVNSPGGIAIVWERCVERQLPSFLRVVAAFKLGQPAANQPSNCTAPAIDDWPIIDADNE